MIYQIKRGRQDINLINDENPKKGYKFVLFVGENGSGKTNFLDFIVKILENDNSTNFNEINKICISNKNLNLAGIYVNLLNICDPRHADYFASYPVGIKKFLNLTDGFFQQRIYNDVDLRKQWDDIFSNHLLIWDKGVHDWYIKNVKDGKLINEDYLENVNPESCINIKMQNGKIQITNNEKSLIDVTPFYLKENRPVHEYLKEMIGKYNTSILRFYTPIQELNDGSANTNIYNRRQLEGIIKALLNDDINIAHDPQNLHNESKKDINKKFINSCLDSFFSKGIYKIDWNRNEKINKICLNGLEPTPTIYQIGDGVLHCLTLATYLARYQNTKNTYFLIDEPETSLHPRAQLEFSKFLSDRNNSNQVFIATHSPFIIKSFLEKYPNDTKIIHFQHLKENDKDAYKADKIENFMILDFLSISEINYHVYNIPSSEYYLQLYEHLKKITGNENKDFKNFDEKYLKNKDFGLEKIQKDSLTNETCLTRLRHLLAHGGDVQNEKGYKKYINKEFSPVDQTKEFYEIFTTNKDNLIDKYTKTLIVLIKNYKTK